MPRVRSAEPQGMNDTLRPAPCAGGRRPAAIVLLATLVYLAAAVVMTLPAWGSPTSSMVGRLEDSNKFIGFLSWYPFALTHGLNPLHMTWIDLPNGINAMWDTTMPLGALLVWPVRAVWGVVAAYDALLLIALTLDGLFTFIWLRRHMRHDVSALLAALLMVAGPYAAARSYGHLNLLLYFPLPLMFMVVENIIREPRVHAVRRGVWLGVLAGIQLLCTEEPLALAAVALLVAAGVAAILAPREAVRRALQLWPAGLGTVIGFLVVGGGPLAYQFLGPSVVHGSIQPHDMYVNDLLNFFIPTSATALSLGGPSMTGAPPVPWSGNPVEWNAYIGVPLLLAFAFTVGRWWRSRWLLVVATTTLAMMVLSLGPHLHINGVDHTHFPLPERILDKLSVFDNILPDRFSLMTDFGLAAVLAVFIDRVVGDAQGRRRALGAAAVALIAASLWPSVVPASAAVVPRYFEKNGDVAKIAPGSVVLVFPIPYVGPPSTTEPALWQAVADFRFKMVSGPSITAGPGGVVNFGSPAEPLKCVADSLQLTGTTGACGTMPSAILIQLRALEVRYIILGPDAPHRAEISSYVTSLTGSSPVDDQGVQVWRL